MSQVVPKVELPPCFTFTRIVELAHVTGISIRIGLLKLRPTLEIPNSTAPFDDSFASSPDVTETLAVVIALTSNPVPVAGVITVDSGRVTRISPDGLNVIAEPEFTVTDDAPVMDPAIVESVDNVPTVTTCETVLVVSDQVASDEAGIA